MATISRPRTRPMTFSACWTCKRRKVRCDENAKGCSQCSRLGVVCGGYDIRLHWSSSSAGAIPGTFSFRSQGRRRIGLDRNVSSVDADLLIEAIEASETALGDKIVTHGPFSIFRLESGAPGDFQDLEEPSSVPASVDEAIDHSPGGVTEHCIHDMNPFETTTLQYLSNCQQDVQVSTGFHSPTSTREGWNNFRHTTDSYVTTDDDDGDDDRNVDSGHTPAQITQSTPVVSQHGVMTTLGSPPCISHLEFSFFHDQDTDTRHLMHHYFNTVTNLLQPITYPQNPYRTLYVPAALAGSLKGMSRANQAVDVVNASVFHALLAASAFHLYSAITSNADYYYSLGIRHRQIALRGVQRALAFTMSTGPYRNLLIAILSLVTIGVMEGSFSDFSLHLNATLRIRQSRKHWKVLSHQTQQVHHISEFLNLLARTTSFSRPRENALISSPHSKLENNSLARFQNDTTLSLGWMSKGVFEGSSHSYEYLYGITTPLICALERVCSLAESLAFYREQQHSIRQDIPNELLEACEALGDDLLAWDLEAENAEILVDKEIISHAKTVEIFTHHAHAWHRAVLIYFYRRIQQYSNYDLVGDVAAVASHMHAIEDIKEKSGDRMPVRMAPITWPAFIASCEATIIDRDIWVTWWTRVCQTYKIANMSRQYDLIQHIWKTRDASNDEQDWIEILAGLRAKVLVI